MRRTEGFALPLALTIMVVTLLLILSTSISMINDRANAVNDRSATQAEEVAKAGFVKYKAAAFQSFRFYVDHPEKYATPASRSAQCGNLLAIGLDLGRDGIGSTGGTSDTNDLINGQSRTESVNVGTAVGTYTVNYIVSGGGIVLRSTGKVNGATAVIQAYLSGQNASAFSNAIFAGAKGQSGKFLNGGGDIYGSVYVEGSPPTSGGIPKAIDSNGTFNFHNFYTKQKLKDLTSLSDSGLDFLKVQAQEQKDLCASVRAQYGSITISGNAQVGDAISATMTSQGFKGTMKGVYAGQPDSTGAYNVNDYVQGSGILAESKGQFDLTPPPHMPLLDESDNVNVSKLSTAVKTHLSTLGITKPTWRQSMQADSVVNGLTIGVVATPVISGNKVTYSYSYPVVPVPNTQCNLSTLMTGNAMQFNETSINCKNAAGRGFSYEYNSATNTGVLDINGTLDLKGLDVNFLKNVVVRYEGKATMLVEQANGAGGNVTIRGDVLAKDSFPDQSVLGIVAENNLNITGETQNDNDIATKKQVVAGLLYAGKQITATSGPVIMGTMMGSSVDLSNGANGGGKTQVFQVPGLEFNLPPGFDTLNNTSVPSFAVYSYERK